jgi:signal transduction histidine kinase
MRSIRSALVLRLASSLVALLLVIGFALWLLLRASLLRDFDEGQEAKAETIATLVSERDGRIDFDFADEIMPEFSRALDPQYFELRFADGTSIERSRSLHGVGLDVPLSAAGVRNSDLRLPDGRRGRATVLRFAPQVAGEEDDESGEPARSGALPLTLALASSREPVDAALASITLWIAFSAAAIGATTVLLVRATVARGLEPLARFSEAVQTLALPALRLDRLSTPLPTELEPVRVRLVQTLEHLAASFEREKRFAAAAAHELRTPIAELKSIAQYALRWPESADETRRSNEEIVALSLRMERLVATCLAIARSETLAPAREPIALAELVRGLWEPLVPRARERGLLWEIVIPRETELASDRALLGTLLGNLLANAVEHARPGGRVSIRAEPSDPRALTIANDCDGLVEADLEHVLEPFWRKTVAGSDEPHAGLGLTLALAIADALSMTLSVELRESTFVATVRPNAGESRFERDHDGSPRAP